MAATANFKCKCCKRDFTARTADRARGWALFCSKSCKAIKQEQGNGQFKAYLSGHGVSNLHPSRMRRIERDRDRTEDDTHPFSSDALGQW